MILGLDNIKKVNISIPPIEEQISIAKFLDKKIFEIDDLIAKNKNLIELEKEKRVSLINHVVTKGLDPKAKMKNSGIDWIGEIPEGWEVKKLKFNVSEKKVKETTNDPETTFIGLEHIESESGILLSKSKLEEIDGESIKFKKNSVLFGKLRPYLAKVILVDFEGSCTGELIVYEVCSEMESKYLYYRLLSKGYIDLVNSLTYGVKMPRADPTQLSNIKMSWPPKQEQQKIAEYLDKHTSLIDRTIKKIEKNINLLEEYKKSLIHHVVTGKVDVRGVAA
jgi:restriction endonuclease S subunit